MCRSMLLTVGILGFALPVHAQTALDVCRAIATEDHLVNRHSRATSVVTAESEFRAFCSNKESRVTNYKNKSSGFKISFESALQSLGQYGYNTSDSAGNASHSSTSGSNLSKEAISQVCERGEAAFVRNFSESVDVRDGNLTAEVVARCVEASLRTAHALAIAGEISLQPDNTGFIAKFVREAQVGSASAVLDSILPPDLICKNGVNRNALGIKFVTELSISCELPQNKDALAGSFGFSSRQANGTLVSKSVRFDVSKRDYEAEVVSKHLHPLLSRIDQLEKVNANEVIAVNAGACPEGWKPFAPAAGRFLRGIDTSADTGKRRQPASLEDDAFQSHHHAMDKGGAPGIFDSTVGQGENRRASKPAYVNRRTFRVLAPISDGANGEPRIAGETRPKNVAVLFCIKG